MVDSFAHRFDTLERNRASIGASSDRRTLRARCFLTDTAAFATVLRTALEDRLPQALRNRPNRPGIVLPCAPERLVERA